MRLKLVVLAVFLLMGCTDRFDSYEFTTDEIDDCYVRQS